MYYNNMFTQEEFEQLVKEGIDAIDEKFLSRLKNVEIVIDDNPTPFQREKANVKNGLLLGLYEGVPQTRREGYGNVLPDKITIFKNQIEAAFSDAESIKKAVKDVVWHEIAHHFGMDEYQVRKAEKRRQ